MASKYIVRELFHLQVYMESFILVKIFKALIWWLWSLLTMVC